MSDPGDYGSVMGRFHTLSDGEVDDLLAGKTPTGNAEFTELAALIEGVKVSSMRPLDKAVEERHLTAIVEAARLASDGTPSGASDPRSARRRSVSAKLLAPRWAKVAAAAMVAVVATGGLAAADMLPQPAQDAIASVAETVGLELPSSDDAVDATDEGEGSEAGEEGETNGKRVDADVHAVLEDDSLEGREKGEAVSDAADQNRQNGNTPASQNPNGYGPDDHPTGPPEGAGGGEGSSDNPNGYGPDNHPTGNPSSESQP